MLLQQLLKKMDAILHRDIMEEAQNYDVEAGNFMPSRKPYGFMQSSFWVIMMVHVMVCGDL